MNIVGQRLKFIADEAVAFTFEGGEIVRWSDEGNGKPQVFQSRQGVKKLLRSDNGNWWRKWREDAPNCWYVEAWFGDFPYGSYCYGFRVCKHTGSVNVESFETEINPRRLTHSDRFIQECKTYCP